MKHLTYSFTTTVEFSEAVSDHSFVLRCMPAARPGQNVSANLLLDPPARFSLQRDSFGNVLVCGSIEPGHASFSYKSYGEADVYAAGGVLEPAHPAFLFHSELTHVSEQMETWARSVGFERGPAATDGTAATSGASGMASADHATAQATLENCLSLTHALHDRMRYEPGSTDVSTKAADAFAQGAGVCQDFAHIMVALLRHKGIPARYVCGITEGEGATHAWAQAHIGGRWHGFDPTRGQACDDGYLMIACGRDWADCPIERGVFRGSASQTQTVFMEVSEQ